MGELGIIAGANMVGEIADDVTKSIIVYGWVDISDGTFAAKEPRCTLGSIPNFCKLFIDSAQIA